MADENDQNKPHEGSKKESFPSKFKKNCKAFLEFIKACLRCVSDVLKKLALTVLILSFASIVIYAGTRLYCLYEEISPDNQSTYFLDWGFIGLIGALVIYLVSLVPAVWGRKSKNSGR